MRRNSRAPREVIERWVSLRWVAVVSLTACGAACARKAPGPSECRAFALEVVGITEAASAPPRLRVAVDDLTRQCLVTPFDRPLLACVKSGAPVRACTLDFERRQRPRERQRGVR